MSRANPFLDDEKDFDRTLAGDRDEDDDHLIEGLDPALEEHLREIGEIDRELEAAIEYKLATGEEAVGEILQMVARVVERRRLLDRDFD